MAHVRTWKTLDRRHFLRGSGAALALPALEAMQPFHGYAAPRGGAWPLRMGFVYLPNGAIMDHWRPRGEGDRFELGPTLESLRPVRSKIQVLSGLDHEKANPNGDGGGDHARANATFLTGCQAKKTAGSDIRVGISVDQVAARHLRGKTRLDSLELGCDPGRKAGRCDSGYSCAYQFNFSWQSESLPLPPEVDPRLVFEKLFGNGVLGDSRKDQAQRAKYHQSLLDYVMEDARELQGRLGQEDRHKLDEYLTGVRELERKIENAEHFVQNLPDAEAPTAIPDSYRDHVRLMYDLMALAFQTDTTRIATFLVAHDGSNRSFKEIEVPEGHHYLSHHRKNAVKIDKLTRIDRFYADQFGYFLQKLDAIREGDGTVLDHSMIVFGGAHSDADRHQHTDLPVVLAGRGSGLRSGRHVHHRGQPMTNLFLTMLDRAGGKEERLGDSTGPLSNV